MKKHSARLIIANSEQCADLYWATRFYVPDPIPYFEFQGKSFLIASDLEYGRAKKEADVDTVYSYSECEKQLKKAGVEKPNSIDVLNDLFRKRKIRVLEVPSYFPIGFAEPLRKKGYRIIPVRDPFFPEREIKSQQEKKSIIETLRATEAGIQAAIDVLKKSKIKNGKIYRDGKILTSEALRSVIEMTMLERGAIGQQTIVASGRQGADPHCRGSGPLMAHTPIVLDVFPKSIRTGYYGDITRTVLKGKASESLKKMYFVVRQSQEAGIKKVRAGIDAAQVHGEVCKVLNASGFETGVLNGKPQGFIHSTGHGLGLDIHERPRVSRLSEILKVGNVITVEPGLYYEKLGGIRIEDVVFVTKAGCEVLTKIPKVFEIN